MAAQPIVVCPSGLPAALLPWRARRGGDAQLIVCKATYRLEPSEATLAREQEPLVFGDTFANDDPKAALRAASDFALKKRRAEVVLMGSAYAPQGTTVRRLVAYLSVGELEKAVEVCADRWVDVQDQLHEGPPFSSMSLGWERASADPDRNPAGRRTSRDAFGRLHLPNLQPVAFSPAAPWTVPTVGLGPIAPSWPQRSSLPSGAPLPLRPGPHGASWPEGWVEQGVPDDADFLFFQVAPRDQQLEHLATDLQIVLENLSPNAAMVGTRLPGHRVRAFLAPGGLEVEMVADTLVIHTDQQTATLTWRGTFLMSSARDLERVVIARENRDEPLTPEEIRALVADEPAPVRSGLPFAQSTAGPTRFSGTPFGGPPAPPSSPALPALGRFETAELPALNEAGLGGLLGQLTPAANARPVQPASTGQQLTSVLQSEAVFGSPPHKAPASSALPAVQPPAPIPAPPAPVGVQPLGVQPLGAQPLGAQALGVQPVAVQPRPAAPGPSALSPSALAQATKPPSYMVDSRRPAIVERASHEASAVLAGVAGASDAAASSAKAAPAAPVSEVKVAASGAKRAPGFFDMLWFLPTLPERLRALPDWRKLLSKDKDKKEFLGKQGDSGRSQEEGERLVRRAIARGTPLDAAGVHGAVLAAIDDDGVLVRPVVTVEGELIVSFDPREALAVSLSLSEPVAAADKKFKETHDVVLELGKSDRKVTLPMIESGLVRLRQAFLAAGKGFPAGYLETSAEHWLVEERKYQKRVVLGEERLIASVQIGSSGSLPLYLPLALEAILPTVPRFKVRVLAEPHARQDAPEGDPTSLVAVAIARVVGR